MTKRHSSKDDRQNYTKLDNDYVRNADKATNHKVQSRKRKMRRIVFFAVVPVIVIGILLNVLAHQKETLVVNEKKKAEVEQQLTELKEQQEMLNLQIKQLEDDEYIAKVLRKEYFLSEEDEIIFVIPEKEDKKDD
ncbi:cell division protein DIVIC [Lysinibacillus contaminans]|uniref:Cell division protein DIVIC n=1 Tax=Lysinibacillus contaminans TaxID=1293441 RepID=A0ABR5K4P7_9BACI|nr:septum formation initiator family protein [Lysinibacillus contaminans]KOS70343.1 cell division protein DIVIC [Lysinibacillus contaminans]